MTVRDGQLVILHEIHLQNIDQSSKKIFVTFDSQSEELRLRIGRTELELREKELLLETERSKVSGAQDNLLAKQTVRTSVGDGAEQRLRSARL